MRAIWIVVGLGLTMLGWGDVARASRGDAPPLRAPDPPPLGSQQREHLRRARAWVVGADSLQQRRAPRVAAPGARPLAGGDGLIAVQSSQLQLSFDPTAGTFQATTAITLQASGAVSAVELYVSPLVSGATQVADGVGSLSTQQLGQGVLRVTLRQGLAAGQSVVLHVDQAGVPDCQTSFLSLVHCMITPAMTYSLTAWEPLIYEVSSGQFVRPQSATLEVLAPSGSVVGASGLAGQVTTHADGSKTFRFTNDYRDGFSFAAAPFSVGTQSFAGGKQTTSYLLPQNAGQAAAWRAALVDIMAFHSARFGAYDPPSIDMVEIPDVAGAAFGPLLAVFLPSGYLGYTPDQWTNTRTLAHELAHQWFGGLIQNADPSSPWLSEGFAEFADVEYSGSLASKSYGYDFRSYLRLDKTLTTIHTVRLAGSEVPITSPQIRSAPKDLYIALTYDKGALVVQMLRYLLGGDAAFLAALQTYRQQHSAQGATPQSFKAALEQSSGLDLSLFFNRWVFGTGYPLYKVALAPLAGGRARVTVTADQDFGVPLELEVVHGDGTRQRVTLPEAQQGPVQVSQVLDSASEVLGVRFDPDHQLLCRSEGALAGDVQINGAVDGIDLITTARVMGRSYDPTKPWGGGKGNFTEWADLVFDGVIDQKDLDLVLGSFGAQTGE